MATKKAKQTQGNPAALKAALQKLVPAWFTAHAELSALMLSESGAPAEAPTSIELALGRPCTAREIADLEKHLKRALPASYRAYLQLYGSGKKQFGAPLGPAEHRSKSVLDALRRKSGLFQELADYNPISDAIPFFVDGDSRRMLLFVPGMRAAGEWQLVDYDITEEMHRYPDLVAYYRDHLATTQDAVARMRKQMARRGVKTTRQAIDAVLAFGATKSIAKTTLAHSLLRLEGRLPGGTISAEAAIAELRDSAEAQRFLAAYRALPKHPESTTSSLAAGAVGLMGDRDHRDKAMVVLDLLFQALPKKPSAQWLGTLNSAVQQAVSAKNWPLAQKLARMATPHTKNNAFLAHNVACVYAHEKRFDDALALCRVAVKLKYPYLDRLATDRDLGPLLRRADFKALFA